MSFDYIVIIFEFYAMIIHTYFLDKIGVIYKLGTFSIELRIKRSYLKFTVYLS